MNCVEISSIFCRILGPLVLGWAPPGEKMLVCIPGNTTIKLGYANAKVQSAETHLVEQDTLSTA